MPFEITNPRFFPGSISGFGLEQTEHGCVVDTTYGVNVTQAQGCLLVDHPAPGLANLALSLVGTVNGVGDTVRALYLLPPNQAAHVVEQLVGMLARVNPDVATTMVQGLHSLIASNAASGKTTTDPEPTPEPATPEPATERSTPQPEHEDAPTEQPQQPEAGAPRPLPDVPPPPNPIEQYMVPVNRQPDVDELRAAQVEAFAPRRTRKYRGPQGMEAPTSRSA